MNHCRDCNSDYATPGTCNCFAPGGKRSAAPPSVPWYPYSPWYPPYYPSYPWWGGTITVGDFPGSSTATITVGNVADLNVSGSSVSLESAMKYSAGCSFTS
jgi:hypothetical protein